MSGRTIWIAAAEHDMLAQGWRTPVRPVVAAGAAMSYTGITTDQSSFYLVSSSGELFWYRDLRGDGGNAADGSTGWDPHSGAQIGVGWNMFLAGVLRRERRHLCDQADR
jgi:hypothetical protein